jgi:Holliday junction resolvase-like predicted endonuclease
MVTPEKVRRLRQAAEAWFAANPDVFGCEARFDVAAERAGKLQVVANAF